MSTMAASGLLEPLSERRFNIFALSLPRGPNFGPWFFHSAWMTGRSECAGAILKRSPSGPFATLVMRRQIDHRFVQTHRREDISSEEKALEDLAANMQPRAAEPLRSGDKRRPALADLAGRAPGEYFKLLTSSWSHYPALMAVGEIYHAMPHPDDNFMADLQTNNFNSRLFELYLLAAFREQDIVVTQPFPSPDFHLERNGLSCWVEAVTANPEVPYPQGLTPPVLAPKERGDRLLGEPAERFAKTLRSKLQREYEKAPHVSGQPLALAIADYHAPGSMVWSREALPSYLYGFYAQVEEGPEGKFARGLPVSALRGRHAIPAGLFRDPSMAHLSAVIFTNAATLGKFNRMGFLAGYRPPGLSMIRDMIIFDRTPGALEPKTARLDVLSEEYAALWPGGEAWCQEMEVYHNPIAAVPIDFELIPGATHWFEKHGVLQCEAYWECSVMSSINEVEVAAPREGSSEQPGSE